MATDTCTPIACSLTDPQLRDRQAELRDEIAKVTVEETSELPDGYVMRFAPDPTIVERLARFIQFERDCCAFITYTLEVQANHGPVSLRLTGPAGTKEFIRGALPAA